MFVCHKACFCRYYRAQISTLGGAIAADIHGKNHHIDGSFCDHIDRFTLLLPSGETAVCSHTENEEYFRATCGGMGLTGMILDATISLKKVPSAFISAQSIPATNLEESLACFDSKMTNNTSSRGWTVWQKIRRWAEGSST